MYLWALKLARMQPEPPGKDSIICIAVLKVCRDTDRAFPTCTIVRYTEPDFGPSGTFVQHEFLHR